ncbi:hypothetical protein DV701_00155 [Ornithinimicrobium avium]|uniref:Integral membrane protein n=1 Tax=Ornithinimicrobium avium TaxID=2283195 RepID=A0A345NIF2_9MICO|nr:hypothetical protein DV701_00155 [Ornithinimicrobium avium]
MTPRRDATTDPIPRERTAGQVATVLVAFEAVALAGIAAFYLYELLIGEGTDLLIIIMSVVTILVFVLGLSYTAKGLRARHPRAQAPAVAFNFLMVPLGIAMFQFAPWWLSTVVLVVAVATIVSVLLMGRLGGGGPPV